MRTGPANVFLTCAMWFNSPMKVMLPEGSFQSSSAGGTKIRSGAVWMLSAERFGTKVSGRGYNARPLGHRSGSILGSISSLYLAPCMRQCCSPTVMSISFPFPVVALILSTSYSAGPSSPSTDGDDIYIGRSETAMWMRAVSSWVCVLLYIWSLLAPVLMPDW